MEDKVEMFEIWREVKEGGEAYQNGKNLKLTAVIVNGYVLKLDEGFALEKRHLSKEEADHIIKHHPLVSPITSKE